MDDDVDTSNYDGMDDDYSYAEEESQETNQLSVDRLPLVPTNFTTIQEALQNFAAVFESRYGGLHPRFQMGSLRDALDDAFGNKYKNSTMEQRPLALYLHRDDGIGGNIFAQQVLCADAISSLLNGQFLLWPWDMTELENRSKFFEWLIENSLLQVKDVVKGVMKDEYPLLIFITKDRGSINVEEVCKGTEITEGVMEKMINCLDNFQQVKSRVSAEEQQRVEREAFRQEQSEAYEESKAIDRAKQEEMQRQREREMQEQQAEVRQLEAKQKRQAELASTIPSEPSESDPNAITIRLRFPSGEQKIRRFRMDEPISWLLNYVESLGYDVSAHTLWTSDVPRKDVNRLDTNLSFAQVGWPRREQIIIDEKI